MRKPTVGGTYGLVALAVLIVLAVAVPYTLLAGYVSFAGAFLFWVVFSVVAIAILLHMLWGWRV